MALVTRTDRAADRVPPEVLVIAGAASVQFGAAFAKTLFDELGPGGTVFLRLAFAAIVLVAIWRPRLSGHTRADIRVAGLFGLTLGAMNLTYYEALDRIPLGIAVTIEFLGPLGVAVAGSRRALDGVWVALAALGIVLLSGGVGGSDLDTLGVVFALVAGLCWAAYILLSARVGAIFPGAAGWRSRWWSARWRSCRWGSPTAGRSSWCRRSWPPASRSRWPPRSSRTRSSSRRCDGCRRGCSAC